MARVDVATMALYKDYLMDLKNNIFISVIGLGYVGLPVAVAFDKNGYNVLGFDIDRKELMNS